MREKYVRHLDRLIASDSAHPHTWTGRGKNRGLPGGTFQRKRGKLLGSLFILPAAEEGGKRKLPAVFHEGRWDDGVLDLLLPSSPAATTSRARDWK